MLRPCPWRIRGAPADLSRPTRHGSDAGAPGLQSADDVLRLLLAFTDEVVGREPLLLVGHSAGAYYAQGLAARRPERVAGLALICPLLADAHDVPQHDPVVASPDLGDEEFRGYFVVQTAAMLDRYQRFVAPAVALVDAAAMERIGERWQLTVSGAAPYGGPTLVVAGRQDSTVGYAAAADLLNRYPRATLAVLDGVGHALPHEQPELLAALLQEWLARALGRGGTAGPPGRRPLLQAPPSVPRLKLVDGWRGARFGRLSWSR